MSNQIGEVSDLTSTPIKTSQTYAEKSLGQKQ